MLLAITYLISGPLYGCEIYANCDANDLRKLKVAYNIIAKYIFNRGVRDSISMFSYQICNMYFQNLLKFKCLIFLHKIIYTAQPIYMCGTINCGRSGRGLVLIQLVSSLFIALDLGTNYRREFK